MQLGAENMPLGAEKNYKLLSATFDGQRHRKHG